VRATPAYVPGEQPKAGQRVIKLNTNENPYPPSPRVLEAMQRGLVESLRLYPDPDASALRAKAALVYGVPIDGILIGNGSDELLSLLVRALVDPGGAVAYPVPTYSLYRTLVALHGARAVEVPYPGDWRVPAALAEAGAPLTFLCNPNAPSGTFVPIARWRSWRAACAACSWWTKRTWTLRPITRSGCWPIIPTWWCCARSPSRSRWQACASAWRSGIPS
jgi:histidinol-phosphate aminotransferase